MPAIGTGPHEYDRKLHRIVMFCDASKASSSTDVAKLLRKRAFEEFAYIREGKSQQATLETIEKYVTYAYVIGLVDKFFSPTGASQQILELEAFQDWLGDLVLGFLQRQGCAPEAIRKASTALLNENPRKVPSIRRVHSKLPNPPQFRDFEYSVRILARLRPATLTIRSQPLFLWKGVLQ